VAEFVADELADRGEKIFHGQIVVVSGGEVRLPGKVACQGIGIVVPFGCVIGTSIIIVCKGTRSGERNVGCRYGLGMEYISCLHLTKMYWTWYGRGGCVVHRCSHGNRVCCGLGSTSSRWSRVDAMLE